MKELCLATLFGVTLGLSIKIFYDYKYTAPPPEPVVTTPVPPEIPTQEQYLTEQNIINIQQAPEETYVLPPVTNITFSNSVSPKEYEEQNLLSRVSYITLSDARSEREYDKLKDAILDLHHRKKQDSEPDLTLKIKFPSEIITKYKSENKFRIWLALLGDYIFLKRILYLVDVGDALRSTDYMRICAEQVCERGNLLFSKQESFWLIEIRGLNKFNNNIKKINSVANILLRALQDPTKITNYVSKEPKDFSTQINEYLDEHNREKLTEQKDIELCDRFIWTSIYTGSFKELQLGLNKLAFLPLADFTELPNLENPQREILLTERESFLNDFSQKIVPLFAGLPNSERESVCQLRTQYYSWLAKRIISWATTTSLTTILKNSLFKPNE